MILISDGLRSTLVGAASAVPVRLKANPPPHTPLQAGMVVYYQAARKYWNKPIQLLSREGSQLVTDCNRLKMTATDGKQRLTVVATAETLLRLVQSVPSPKAEPIKLWLATVGYERIQEMADPAISLNRARETWQKHGRSEKWIQQRMTGQETRNKLTDYWSNHDIKQGEEFAILINIIHQEWSGVSS